MGKEKDNEEEAAIKHDEEYQEATQISTMKTSSDIDIKKTDRRSNRNEEKCVC